MRKLKLQMHITVDGCVAGPNGESDWMVRSDEGFRLVESLIDGCDTILMGRKMANDFMNYWENITNNHPESPVFNFAGKMVNTPKVVFSRTLDTSVWTNTVLAKGNLADEVADLKNQSGKDIIVYGGADFVASLIAENLIDEFNLFVNPILLGAGMRIFDKIERRQKLSLISSDSLECGITVLRYKLVNE
jgi:dihydrofolate reductase